MPAERCQIRTARRMRTDKTLHPWAMALPEWYPSRLFVTATMQRERIGYGAAQLIASPGTSVGCSITAPVPSRSKKSDRLANTCIP